MYSEATVQLFSGSIYQGKHVILKLPVQKGNILIVDESSMIGLSTLNKAKEVKVVTIHKTYVKQLLSPYSLPDICF